MTSCEYFNVSLSVQPKPNRVLSQCETEFKYEYKYEYIYILWKMLFQGGFSLTFDANVTSDAIRNCYL